jgi:hypothetical protein
MASPEELAPQESAAPHPAAQPVILACEMIEDEVLLAAERAYGPQATPPLVWIESGLHEVPESLRNGIQGLVDLVDLANKERRPVALPSVRPGRGPAADRRTEVVVEPPVTHVLLALGYCGNGLQGLESATAALVFPRVDDCISLFLNGGCTREEIDRDAHAFYLTKGWLCHDNPVKESFEKWRERFGEERARRLRHTMMAAYRRITLIDTGAFDAPAWEPESQAYADDLELDHTTVSGSIQLLERLFGGPWNSEIVVVPPGRAISVTHLFQPVKLG